MLTDGHVFEEVRRFNYLDALIVKKNDVNEEMKMKFAAGNIHDYGL
jgi:hypothetical protein